MNAHATRMEAAYASLRQAVEAENRAHKATSAAMVAAARAGWPRSTIGEIMGLCHETVRSRVREAGVSLGSRGGRGRKRGRQPDAAMRAGKMKQLRGRGWTMDRIACRYGVTRQRVHQILREPELVYGPSGRAY